MRVMIAGEESQTVCIAFRALGHEAYSCDLKPCSGGHPEWHIQDDALKHLDDGWDILIAHPPCTYLSKAGAKWLFKKGNLDLERYNKGLQAKEFFLKLYNSKIPHIACENPTPLKIFDLPKPTQVIQPYQFGHAYSKRTLLWLKGLPRLFSMGYLVHHVPYISSNTYGKKRGQKVSHGVRNPRLRAKTFEGIAKAMAQQWGVLNKEREGSTPAEHPAAPAVKGRLSNPNCQSCPLTDDCTRKDRKEC